MRFIVSLWRRLANSSPIQSRGRIVDNSEVSPALESEEQPQILRRYAPQYDIALGDRECPTCDCWRAVADPEVSSETDHRATNFLGSDPTFWAKFPQGLKPSIVLLQLRPAKAVPFQSCLSRRADDVSNTIGPAKFSARGRRRHRENHRRRRHPGTPSRRRAQPHIRLRRLARHNRNLPVALR